MKYLLMMVMVIAAVQVAASGVYDIIESLAERAEEASVSSEVEVVELFRAQTPEELEAALTDGYPMPWLEEILNDESIPEEDRYWLDCRMRAVIAQDIHLFFDEEGNPIHVEADWIMPGEHYWRETFVLAPPGDQTVFHSVESGGNLRGEIGQLVDRLGKNIGEIALTARLFHGSRDGSIWASSLCRVEGKYQLVLLYSDGSYFVSPIEMGYGRCGVSESGDYVFLAAQGKKNLWNREDIPHRAILVDKAGEIVWETEMEMPPVGNLVPVISPDDRYCVVASSSSSAEDPLNLLLQVFDMETGQEVWRLENPTGYRVTFSPDGNTLFIPGNKFESYAINISNGEQIWSDERISTDDFEYTGIRFLKGSNNADILSVVIRPPESTTAEWYILLLDNAGTVIAADESNRSMSISPNGYLVVSDNFHPSNEGSASPIIIRRVFRGGE